MSSLPVCLAGRMTGLRNRARALALAILLEALLVMALLTLGQKSVTGRTEERSLATFDLVAESKPVPEPARPKPPSPRPPEPLVISPPFPTMPQAPSDEVTTLLAQQDRVAAAGIACDLAVPVQTALQSSPEAQLALRDIPATERSVANAIMLWDGAWTATSDGRAVSALRVIQELVIQTIAAAGRDCRLQAQTGPRLLYVSSGATTTSLAIGSGQWRWQDVIDTAQAPNADITLSATTDRSGTTDATK